jgi:hypothetical protein
MFHGLAPGFYIVCRTFYHVQHSEYRVGSVLPQIEPPLTLNSTSRSLHPSSIPTPAISMQALRLVVILPGSPLSFGSLLHPPFAFSPTRNLTRGSKIYKELSDQKHTQTQKKLRASNAGVLSAFSTAMRCERCSNPTRDGGTTRSVKYDLKMMPF